MIMGRMIGFQALKPLQIILPSMILPKKRSGSHFDSSPAFGLPIKEKVGWQNDSFPDWNRSCDANETLMNPETAAW